MGVATNVPLLSDTTLTVISRCGKGQVKILSSEDM